MKALSSSSLQKIASSLSLYLICSLSLTALDNDNDGMSDVWQRVHGIATGDTASDPDGDGWTNLQEAQNGTNPHDANDFFKIITQKVSPDLSTLDISWRSLEDRSYKIESSQDLTLWTQINSKAGIVGKTTSVTMQLPNIPTNDSF